MLKSIAAVAAVLATYFLASTLARPLAAILACWLVLFAGFAFTASNSVRKAVWFNLAFVVFLVLGLELYAQKRLTGPHGEGDRVAVQGSVTEDGYSYEHDMLGYAPVANQVATASKYFDDEVIYDVSYRINAKGLRVAAPGRGTESNKCLLFFGGSFTFGEGVEDEQTTPYLVGTQLGIKTLNFGFHGYGPHQMLAAIEGRLVEQTLDCQPVHAIYQAIPDHVARASGERRWNNTGPHYELSGEQGVVFAGSFQQWRADQFASMSILEKLRYSLIERSYIKEKYFGRVSAKKWDYDLFAAILEEAKASLRDDYPGLRFSVILWDHDPKFDEHAATIKAILEQREIDTYLVSQAIPDFHRNREQYLISPPHEVHPGPAAYEALSAYITAQVLSVSEASPGRISGN